MRPVGGEIAVGLLGPVRVRSDDGWLRPGTPQQCLVLSFLALRAGQVVPAGELVDAVWDSDPPRSAHNGLQVILTHVRKALVRTPGAQLARCGAGYRLDVDPGRIDVHQFRSMVRAGRDAGDAGSAVALLDQALMLWRGPALADAADTAKVAQLRDSLAQERLAAAEDRIGALLRCGRAQEAAAELPGLVAENPLRERLAGLLMLALYRTGRQGAALAAYQQVRGTLVTELGIEPGDELQQLHRRILAGDPGLLPAAPVAGPPATSKDAPGHKSPRPGGAQPGEPAPVKPRQPSAVGSVLPPRQLPGTPAHFVGRAAELAALASLLDRAGTAAPGTVVISAIGGTAGVGKTALAAHFAHQVAWRFPDGQLYVNLRGYDPGPPVTAADALAGFLRALGVRSQDIPADDGERAARYRTLLAVRRMLVVLDNAGSAEQVRPLLPGTSECVTIVTSRDSLAGLVARDGAARLDLDLLPLGDAVKLLRSLIGDRVDADPGAAAALAGQCAQLPLALRVAAELAAARPAEPLSDLVGELADQQRRLDRLDGAGDSHTAVRAVFSWSCRQLDAETQRAFRLAGLHPGAELDRYAVAALTGSTPGRAGGLLEALARAHLIQPARPGRYSLHDLLRAYARELAAAQDGEDESAAALSRLFDYYLCTAAAAMDILVPAESHRRPRLSPPASLVQPVLRDTAAARDWLDTERASLAAVASHMAAHGWAGQAIRLAAILFRHFQISGHYPEAIAIHGYARDAARATSDRAAEATALTNLGAARMRQGDIQQAAGNLQRALELARESGDRTCAARALHTLGNIGIHQGRYQQAAGHLQQALHVYNQLGDRTGQARTLNNLGAVEALGGRYQEAEEFHQRSLALHRETGNRTSEARTIGNLACVYRRQGRYRQAIEHIERSLAISRAADDRCAEAYAVIYLGDVRTSEGRYQQAVGHYQQALALLQDFGDRPGEVRTLNGLGEAFLASGHPAEACPQHAAALDLARQIGDRYERARAHHGLAQAYQGCGHAEQARVHWQQALDQFTSLGTPEAEQIRTQLAATGTAGLPASPAGPHASDGELPRPGLSRLSGAE